MPPAASAVNNIDNQMPMFSEAARHAVARVSSVPTRHWGHAAYQRAYQAFITAKATKSTPAKTNAQSTP
jgi:hypothetical protein